MDATSTISNLINSFTQSITGLANTATVNQAKDLVSQASSVNLATPTWDFIIFLFFGITVIFYGFLLEKEKIINLLVSSYLALAVATNVPYLDKLSEVIAKSGLFAFRVSAFILVFIVLFILLSRSSILSSFSGLSGSWWQIILFSFLQVGLLLSIILSFLPQLALNYLSIFTKIIFTSDLAKFLWIVLPIVALIFLGESGSSGRDWWPPSFGQGRKRHSGKDFF